MAIYVYSPHTWNAVNITAIFVNKYMVGYYNTNSNSKSCNIYIIIIFENLSPYGPMDKAPAYGVGDSEFESQ